MKDIILISFDFLSISKLLVFKIEKNNKCVKKVFLRKSFKYIEFEIEESETVVILLK